MRVHVCACVRAVFSERPEPRGGREAADFTPRRTPRCRPGLCSAARPPCGGGASPTMQFFKSSLILLFASQVVLCWGGDLGLLAQG